MLEKDGAANSEKQEGEDCSFTIKNKELKSPNGNIHEGRSHVINDDNSNSIADIPHRTKDKKDDVQESCWNIGVQICVPFVVAGLGMVGAGLLLDKVQHYGVFDAVPEVFILVPALLGLKGNLEMTLASRLSTQANLGNVDDGKELTAMIVGNLVLTQAQAIVVGFLASVSAMLMGWIPRGKFDVSHGVLLCATSVVTASAASFILGCVMSVVVWLAWRFRVNPDNVATPIAASLGDVTTLGILSLTGSFFYQTIEHHRWIGPVVIISFVLIAPLWFYLAASNRYVRDVIYTGWTPVIAAMLISSVGGLILDTTVAIYPGLAVFQPVINGIGGNLVAVLASRMSTALHSTSKLGVLPAESTHACPNLIKSFCSDDNNSRASRVLLSLVVPGHLLFILVVSLLNAGHTDHSPQFCVVYLAAAFLQVALLLYAADWLVHALWKRGIDPDNSAIPYLTSLGDLLGTGFLALAFHVIHRTRDNPKL